MKRITWLISGIALLVLVAAPLAIAEEKAAKEKPAAKASLKGEYAMMVKECKLTDDQQAKLKGLVEAKDAALATWQKDNGDKVKAAQETSKKAKESGDRDAAKKAGEDVKALNDAKAKIQAEGMAPIYAILNPEQKQAWEGFTLYRSVSRRFAKAELKAEQESKIRPMCDEAAKEMAAVKGDDKEAKKARAEIEAKLTKKVEETVLTAVQREAMAKKPAKTEKAAEKKPSEEKKPAATATK